MFSDLFARVYFSFICEKPILSARKINTEPPMNKHVYFSKTLQKPYEKKEHDGMSILFARVPVCVDACEKERMRGMEASQPSAFISRSGHLLMMLFLLLLL